MRAGQCLLERLTLPTIGEYLTRHPLPHVRNAGFTVEAAGRQRAGIVERVTAIKPTATGAAPPA